jgi:hypothetical protein
VLDDDDGVPGVDQSPQHVQELSHVVEVKPGGGLVQDVEGAAGGPLGQLAGQLDALGLPARERRRLLAQVQIVEPDVGEQGQRARDLPMGREQVRRLAHRQLQNVRDRLALVGHEKRGVVEATSGAFLAAHVDVG